MDIYELLANIYIYIVSSRMIFKHVSCATECLDRETGRYYVRCVMCNVGNLEPLI